MEDPKYKGIDCEPVYEQVKPVVPKLLYYRSRVDGTMYNEDGTPYVTEAERLAKDRAAMKAEAEKRDEALKAKAKADEEKKKAAAAHGHR